MKKITVSYENFDFVENLNKGEEFVIGYKYHKKPTHDGVIVRVVGKIEKSPATKEEKTLLNFLKTGWLVRFYDKNIWWSNKKPYKGKSGEWETDGVFRYIPLKGGVFPFITCYDEEPWSIEKLLEEHKNDK